jgi:16S rRNA (guanine527-N7)-methyltransferase
MNIANHLEAIGLNLAERKIAHLSQLAIEHLKWNQTFNISAFRDENAVATYQIIDSLSVYPFIELGSLLDVGTGPGFPGLPLAIVFPELQVTLLDSSDKKLAFARHMKAMLQLGNVTVVHQRIESFEPLKPYEQIISRAFTDLSGMISVTLRLLSEQGQILAMKGARIDAEIADAAKTHRNCRIDVHKVPHVVDEHRVLAVVKRTHA